MNIFLLSLCLIVVGGALPLLTYRHFVLTKFLYALTTTIGCLTGLFALCTSYSHLERLSWSWSWLHTFSLSFTFDSLTFFFLLPIFLICPLAAIYSFHYFDDEEKSFRIAVNLFFTNILIASMVLVTTAGNMLTLALVWEIMSVSSFFLVIYDYEKETSRTAGYLYFLFAQAGALIIFAAFAVIFSHTASFEFSGAATLPESTKLLVFLLAFVGFGSKAGVFPLHIWLPHAHPAAPSHISAIMSGVMIKMGIYGILRIYFILESTNLLMGQTVLVFGMISGVLGVLYALGKHNIKRLLAYHSVENIGIILIGAGLGMIGLSLGDLTMAGFGFGGCLLHVLNHSIFKSLLFMGAGTVIKQTGTAHVDQLGGLMKTMPATGRSFLVGSVSISGLPPFNGFISEFLIYFAAFLGLQYPPHATLLLTILAIISLAIIGGLASFCFTKVVGIVFLGEPRTKQFTKTTEGGLAMTIPMVILATACLVIGIFPQQFIALAVSGLRDLAGLELLDPALCTTIGAQLALASRLFLLIFIVIFFIRKMLYRKKEITSGPTWGCGFTQGTTRIQYTGTSYARTVVSFFKPFVMLEESTIRLKKIFPGQTTYTNQVGDIAEAGMAKGLTGPLVNLLGRLRWIQHGNVQLYIGYIIVAIMVVLLTLFI